MRAQICSNILLVCAYLLLVALLIASIIGLILSIYYLVADSFTAYNVKIYSIFACTLMIILTIAAIVIVTMDRFCRHRFTKDYSDYKFLLDVDIRKLPLEKNSFFPPPPPPVINQQQIFPMVQMTPPPPQLQM